MGRIAVRYAQKKQQGRTQEGTGTERKENVPEDMSDLPQRVHLQESEAEVLRRSMRKSRGGGSADDKFIQSARDGERTEERRAEAEKDTGKSRVTC